MLEVFFYLQFVLAALIIVLVLSQKSANMGFTSGGSNDGVFGVGGGNNFLVNTTFILIALFVFNTIALGYMYNKSKNLSLIDTINTSKLDSSSSVPSAPSAPKAPTEKTKN